MNLGKTLFAQIMEFVPWTSFARIVARYGGDVRVRNLSCTEQFRAMAFAQLTYRESLRDIETCLRANQTKLHGMGFRSSVKRSMGSGTYFVSLSELQRVAAEYRGDGSSVHAHNFAIGAVARVIASTLVAPITVLKTRLEASDSLHRSGFDITRHMLQQHPLRSSFAGLVPRPTPNISTAFLYRLTPCQVHAPHLVGVLPEERGAG